jgi:hypothetical protein
LGSEKYADLVMQFADGTELKAHRNILSTRSPVFFTHILLDK